MIYLNSKYLAKSLGINLAKWKRWSREFLDPDPLGGFQSGYARQFSKKEAFRVYLGGYLVADLQFTIAQARQILSDLNHWLKKHHFYSLSVKNSKSNSDNRSHQIYIYHLANGKFGYAIRRYDDHSVQKIDSHWQEQFELQLIGLPLSTVTKNEFVHCRVLYINNLHHNFLLKIKNI